MWRVCLGPGAGVSHNSAHVICVSVVCLRPDFSVDHSDEVKTIEGITNHDVKAVEYFLREKVRW